MKFHTGNFTRPVAGGKAIGEAGRWARSCPARAAGSTSTRAWLCARQRGSVSELGEMKSEKEQRQWEVKVPGI